MRICEDLVQWELQRLTTFFSSNLNCDLTDLPELWLHRNHPWPTPFLNCDQHADKKAPKHPRQVVLFLPAHLLPLRLRQTFKPQPGVSTWTGKQHLIQYPICSDIRSDTWSDIHFLSGLIKPSNQTWGCWDHKWLSHQSDHLTSRPTMIVWNWMVGNRIQR